MALTGVMFDENNRPLLLPLPAAVQYLRETVDNQIDAELLRQLSSGLLPVFLEPEPRYLAGDLDSLAPVLRALVQTNHSALSTGELFGSAHAVELCIGESRLPLGTAGAGKDEPGFYPALRHLIKLSSAHQENTPHQENVKYLPWLAGTTIRAAGATAEMARIQLRRADRIASFGTTDFARTAYYMGTKRDLGQFLVEAIATALPENGTILDLMCGSGAASGAFARSWRTVASDAQAFSRVLATVQGRGFNAERANALLPRILELARSHELELRRPLESLLRLEMELCHSDLTPELAGRLAEYVRQVPTYPGDAKFGAWHPAAEVAERRRERSRLPYCLFTAYFPTVFFGLRQAVEIDSLRFAIGQLEDRTERDWALGALIVSTSVRATTYAAHFAQPPIQDFADLSLSRIANVLEKWAGSVYHEFAARLVQLAAQSESTDNPVSTIPGPWRTAVDSLAETVGNEPIAVYLDAPYTRDEYSRYYHVLETLVRYDYPSATGRGKVPSKARAERFASELFTRNQGAMERRLSEIIQYVLEHGWICAWSYSSTGSARIPAVMDLVAQGCSCTVESFSMPHRHVSQRGRGSKEVVEYLLLFVPNDRARRF